MSSIIDKGAEAERFLAASVDRQVPFPSPESIVAKIIATHSNGSKPTAAERKLANKITNGLRSAGWRILR